MLCKVGDGTGEISLGRWDTGTVTAGISWRSEVQGEAGWEVGGGHSTDDHWDNTTRWEGRVSTSTELSREVSEGACPYRIWDDPTQRQITRTPAQAVPGGQEEQEPTVSCALWPHVPARYTAAGPARSGI